MSIKRSTKWYRKNESEIMKRLGFKPTKNSGAGWIEKADGQSEHCICELKSTDKASFSVKQEYLHTLEYNALVAHKLPVFAFQFIQGDEVWVAIKESDIEAFRALARCEEKQESKTMFNISDELRENVDYFQNESLDNETEIEYNNSIEKGTANKRAREAYMKQREKEREAQNQFYKTKMRERRKRGKEI